MRRSQVPADHVHYPELRQGRVEEWFAVGSMERGLGLHNRHTGDWAWADSTSGIPIILGTVLSHAGWRAGGSQWPGGRGEAERALRRGMRLRQQRARR
jgi:hypothetical protein